MGPDNRTAFALSGAPNLTGLWNDPARHWALVDLEEGRVVRDGDLSFGNGTFAAYSSDGRWLAAGGYDGDVVILDANTGKPVRTPVRAHRDFVAWMAFSPDGTRLLSAATDGTVVLWDVATASIVARVTAPYSSMSSAEFMPDGRILIAPWHDDPAVFVWDPDADRTVEFACRAAGRDLTRQEWEANFAHEPYRATCPHE